MSRVAVLWNPDAINKKALQATKDAAERFDVTVTSYEVRNISDFGPAFSSISKETDDGMIVFSDGLTYARRQDFIDFALSRIRRRRRFDILRSESHCDLSARRDLCR